MTKNPSKKKIKVVVSSNRFENLPHELVSEVLGRVAASSITDIFNAKLSCKRLNEVGEDVHVYQRVSLDKFPVIPWNPLSEKQAAFLNRCREYENPELMYRQAVLNYFNGTNLRSTCMNLQKALKRGHMGAMYVTCIVLLLSEDNELKQRGIKMLGDMEKSGESKKKMRLCRKNLFRMLDQIWVKNPILREPPICCPTRDQHQRKRKWSEEEEDENLRCEACIADREISFLSGRYNNY